MAAPFALIWFFSRGRAMGLGDAKLAVFFPWLLGVAKGLSAIIIGFWLGAIVSVAALMLKAVVARFPRRFFPTLRARFRTLSLKTELPLGPFLALGLFLVYVFGWDITGLEHLLR
jgi:prepilin signal peptidase PulO-like enzyme (type II secretory pathway)